AVLADRCKGLRDSSSYVYKNRFHRHIDIICRCYKHVTASCLKNRVLSTYLRNVSMASTCFGYMFKKMLFIDISSDAWCRLSGFAREETSLLEMYRPLNEVSRQNLQT